MVKENLVYMNNAVIFCHKEEWNDVICRKMDGTGDHHAKWNKPDSDNDHMLSFICRI
jgi:hypothetical protein